MYIYIYIGALCKLCSTRPRGGFAVHVTNTSSPTGVTGGSSAMDKRLSTYDYRRGMENKVLVFYVVRRVKRREHCSFRRDQWRIYRTG